MSEAELMRLIMAAENARKEAEAACAAAKLAQQIEYDARDRQYRADQCIYAYVAELRKLANEDEGGP